MKLPSGILLSLLGVGALACGCAGSQPGAPSNTAPNPTITAPPKPPAPPAPSAAATAQPAASAPAKPACPAIANLPTASLGAFQKARGSFRLVTRAAANDAWGSDFGGIVHLTPKGPVELRVRPIAPTPKDIDGEKKNLADEQFAEKLVVLDGPGDPLIAGVFYHMHPRAAAPPLTLATSALRRTGRSWKEDVRWSELVPEMNYESFRPGEPLPFLMAQDARHVLFCEDASPAKPCTLIEDHAARPLPVPAPLLALTGSPKGIWAIFGATDNAPAALGRFEGAGWAMAPNDALADAQIMTTTREGVVWVATSQGRLLRHDGAAWQEGPCLPWPRIDALAATADDDLWASTAEAVAHYDGKSWSRPSEIPGGADALVTLDDGSVFASGDLGIWYRSGPAK